MLVERRAWIIVDLETPIRVLLGLLHKEVFVTAGLKVMQFNMETRQLACNSSLPNMATL